jgi:CO/xanthine dehydrogenase Mo-binding subunit
MNAHPAHPAPAARGGPAALPADLAQNPLLSQWVQVAADGTVCVFAGKVELGQGAATMLLQVAADELDIAPAGLRLSLGDTARCPDQGLTAGSLTTEVGAMALRRVCAEVRWRFVLAAAQRLGVEPASVQIDDGRFSAPGCRASFSYGELAGAVDLQQPARGDGPAKAPDARRVAGRTLPRTDLLRKLSGAGFIHDIEWPDMLHGRMVRPPSAETRLPPLDAAWRQAVLALPGVRAVCVEGLTLGVAADREEQAVAAAIALRSRLGWANAAAVPDDAGASTPGQDWLRRLATDDSTVDACGSEPDPQAVAQRFEADYSRPYLAHASIGPSCALARWVDGALTVCTHSQGVYPLRRELATYFGIDPQQVTVTHADGAGCYGHNGADDAAFDAAILARAAGRPVRLQWSREDEMRWSPVGPAMSVRIRAALDAQGRIAHWQHDTWSPVHVQRPGLAPELSCLAARLCDPPHALPPLRDFPLPAGGGQRNAVPIYALPARHIGYHLVRQPPLRGSALRTLGAYANVFAIESAMDELAELAGQDPLGFRLAHLEDARAAAVLQAAASAAGWQTELPPARRAGAARGRGLALARYKNSGAYCALVVEIEVTDRIVLDRVWLAVDAGEVVNPDGLVNQIEGGFIQAASWTLKESLQWDDAGVRNSAWSDYPILGFDEVPAALHVQLMSRPSLPPLGVGECVAGPAAAAIANALAHALGLRARHLPLTPEALQRLSALA